MTAADKQDFEEIITRLFPQLFGTSFERSFERSFGPAFDKAIDAAITTKIEPMMQRVVGDTVGEIVSDALELIDARFDRVEAKIDETRDLVDHHTIDIRQLQRKLA